MVATAPVEEECLGDDASLNLLQTKASMVRARHVARLSLEPSAAMPKGFVVNGRTPRAQTIELSFFVKQQNLKHLEDVLLNVSDPFLPSYGQHWSSGEVHKLVAPKAEHIDTVMEHLQSFGIQAWRATPNGDVLAASVTAEQAEELLEAKFEAVSHLKTGRVMHRCLGGYTLPHHVASVLDFVSPTVHLMSPPPPSVHAAAGTSSPKPMPPSTTDKQDPKPTPMPEAPPTTTKPSFNNSGICPDPLLYPTTPKALRTLYSVAGTVGQETNSKQAVTGFLGQTYNLQNLKDYWALYCHGIMCGKGDPGDIGDKTFGEDKVEAMLDIDVITSVAGNVYTEFWGFDPPGKETDPFVNWLVKVSMTSDDVIPKIFSSSYGEDENGMSAVHADRLNMEFIKMGVRGISVLFASGDEGANLEGLSFGPEMFGASPFVTAVGATAPTKGFPLPGSEVATALSSGGFSNYWKMPAWQKDAVETYLQKPGLRLPNMTKYNVETRGRAYPDVSAQGYSFCVTPMFVEGVLDCQVGGTSAAAPTMSGIFSLLNDLRAGMGKSPLGFLNPLIYRYPEAFQDITTGYNTLNGSCTSAPAWPAAVGWDAVTGHGTPNYAKLASIVSKLP